MIKLEFKDYDGNNWTRVSLRRARALYNNGHTIVVVPVLAHPFGPWRISASLNRLRPSNAGRSFDAIVNEYMCYNSSEELGKYAAYYVRSEVIGC